MMQAWQERVAVEAEELRIKHAALGAFLLSGDYRALGEEERDLLKRQHFVMTDYLHCLCDRMLIWERAHA